MREALPDHAAVDGLLELQPAARPRQRDPRIMLFRVGHLGPVVSLGSARRIGAAPPGESSKASARKPARRCTSRNSRCARPPWRNRGMHHLVAPQTRAQLAAREGSDQGQVAVPVGATSVRPSAAPSAAAISTPACDARSHARTCSKPRTSWPARRARPTPAGHARPAAARPYRPDLPPPSQALWPPVRTASRRRPCLPHPGPHSTTYHGRAAARRCRARRIRRDRARSGSAVRAARPCGSRDNAAATRPADPPPSAAVATSSAGAALRPLPYRRRPNRRRLRPQRPPLRPRRHRRHRPPRRRTSARAPP